MLRGGDVKEIRELHRQGLSITQIHELTGYSRDTIRKYLDGDDLPRYGPRAPRPTQLDPFVPYLEERLAAGVWNGVVLLRELQAKGYRGSYTRLKAFLQPRRAAAWTVAVRRFETPPGHQAQVDWGEIGWLETAAHRHKLSCFVLTLGYSRALFADVAGDQTLRTLLRMHEAAFEELGGVPREILYDWMKTVALGTDDRGEVRWNPTFLDFAGYWGFTPRLCRPYRPQTKGKTESGVGYIKKSFLPGRTGTDLEDLRSQLREWRGAVANCRVHGTTHRIVREVWEEEKPVLLSGAGRAPYPYEPQVTRKVARDAYVSYGTNRYPVPWQLAGQRVTVVERDGQVVVLQGTAPIARHPCCPGRHQVLAGGAYHAGMPTSDRCRRNPSLTIRQAPPIVEVRDLAVYEQFAADIAGGER